MKLQEEKLDQSSRVKDITVGITEDTRIRDLPLDQKYNSMDLPMLQIQPPIHKTPSSPMMNHRGLQFEDCIQEQHIRQPLEQPGIHFELEED